MSKSLVAPSESPYLVPFEGDFRLAGTATRPPDGKAGKDHNKKPLKKAIKSMRKLQRKLYADDRYALLLVFQAIDAGGKDSTIRAVMSGVNPAGCQVFSFKQPSKEELEHDFLWRIARSLPERGRIGIFNRSHYEEVLVVRVHPEYLENQRIPMPDDLDQLWEHRYRSIREFERHLAANGTVILKFFLNLSHEEQKNRFLRRIDRPDKHWKFSPADIEERQHWDAYRHAYQEALAATSRPWAPWYAIPADDKPYMRRTVAEIIDDTLERLDLRYPDVGPEHHALMKEARARLEKE
jgi:PPK2 family polyphosphate:nucleotide phosphotransferase